MIKNFISEDQIEQALLQKLHTEHGFELLNCFTAKPDDINDGSNRKDKRLVVLADRLTSACIRLNPKIPKHVIDTVVEKITDRRSTMSTIVANRELDSLIRNGVSVKFDDDNGVKQDEMVKLVGFDGQKNEYLAVSQLWIKSTGQTPYAAYRRPDVILYVNGLPLVFVELKNSNVKLRSAYDDNLANYKNDIPQLFHCNAFCLLSNAIETKIGSFTAGWEHFFNWLRKDEKELVSRKEIKQKGVSLENVVDGVIQPSKLLDYIESFILFYKDDSKIIAQNHQFLGVNNAFDRFLHRKEYKGKLGVFWHTQGSGKSFSMIFYVQKIFHKVVGNFSFVVVTDRKSLDGQIYRNFLHTGTIKKKDAAQPANAEEMRKFLGQNKKVVFTLIQKFRYDKGIRYPHLFNPNEREVVVMVDEAHRTQYKDLAENMRDGLAGAHFLAFTGTPLLGKERKTNKWFGEYVSEYNFLQATEDGATVPLFYEKRVPEVLIQNDNLSEEFCELLEDEDLTAAQQEKLEKKFTTEMEIIKRDDRLEIIAKDIVYHFPRRGYLGKGMVISCDKFTAVKMYEKVQRLWKEEIKKLRGEIGYTILPHEQERIKKIVHYMRSVKMAVVISDPSAEKEKFEKAELNIETHIKRLNGVDKKGHDIEYNFKDPEHPLQLVFVCAMWLTGFDVQTLSTLYIDKPMKNHSLMQTIARANRVSSYKIQGYTGQLVKKTNGELVDYYNVFRNMRKALSVYAQGKDTPQLPVPEKTELFALLDDAIEQTVAFCSKLNIDLDALLSHNSTFKSIAAFEKYADILLGSDEQRKSFYVYENTVSSLYEACRPNISKQDEPLVAVIQYLRGVIDVHVSSADIDDVSQKVSEFLDESIIAAHKKASSIKESFVTSKLIGKSKILDLSNINFDLLQKEFKEAKYKNIEIADMKAFIEDKLRKMMEQNETRVDFATKLHEIVDRYNAGGSSNENYFDELVKFTKSLKEEDARHIREELTEDELEVYDILKKEKMTNAEKDRVKLAAKHLITRLRDEHPKVLVQDWWKDGQTKLQVKSVVEEVLDKDLPRNYDKNMFREKTKDIFELILDFAVHGKKWVA